MFFGTTARTGNFFPADVRLADLLFSASINYREQQGSLYSIRINTESDIENKNCSCRQQPQPLVIPWTCMSLFSRTSGAGMQSRAIDC